MKKISAALVGIFMMLTILTTFAQNVTEAKASFIKPYPLVVSYSKTTNLIFPYAIKSVDKGSRDLLVQKAIGVENILQVKAAKQWFGETNLTVVTADGSLFSYTVTYLDAPGNLNLMFSNPQVAPKPVAVFAKDATTDQIAIKSKEVINRERTLKGLKDDRNDIKMEIKGLFIKDDVLYFQLAFQNNSSIDYDIQSLRFFIHDKKKSKRTASQDVELPPVYELGNIESIRHQSEQVACIALTKFTIPDKKYLEVQMMEKNGGRHLSLKVKNKVIIHSTIL